MGYHTLKENELVNYLKERNFFSPQEKLDIKEIGDGNLNNVFRIISETGKSIVVKQALPYVKIVGSDWPLPLERNKLEAEAIKIQGKLAPGLVPEIYYIDEELALTIMEDLSRLEIMRLGTIKMKKYPNFVKDISTFLANVTFYTSDFYMNPIEKKDLVKKFINPHLCKITEDLIFTDPYYNSPRNRINPELNPYLENKFWKRTFLWKEASKLKFNFMTKSESLLHGDLHTGSIFISQKETKVFDSEFAFFGPSAFDMGLLVGNLLINYVSWEGKSSPKGAIEDYRLYILETIEGIYNMFVSKFTYLFMKESKDISFKVNGYLDYFFHEYFLDMLGYAGVVMIRRMHGLAHNIDIDEIEDLKVRSSVQKLVLELATNIILTRKTWESISEFTSYIQSIIF